MAFSRSSSVYRRLRQARNVALATLKRLPNVHPTSYVYGSVQALPDLRTEEYVFVGPRCSLATPGVSIGRYTMLAEGVAVVGDDHVWDVPGVPMQFAGRPEQRRTSIGRDAWLGREVTVMSGVTIGDGAIIATRSVVTKDVPPREVWAGVPAQKLRDRFDTAQEAEEHARMVAGPVAEPTFAEPKALADRGRRQDRPHLCIVTTAHPIDDVRVYSKVARSFVEAGWKVTWVGPLVSFFAGEDFRDPDIEYILTAPLKSKLDRVQSGTRVKAAASTVPGVDWYYSPDPDAAAITAALAKGTRARTMLDLHEEYHGAHIDRWTFGRQVPLAREAVRRRISALCARTDLVIGVNDSVLQPYAAQHPHALVVRNCAPRWFADRSRDIPAPQLDDPVTFMHGKALPSNGTQVVLDALARVPEVRVVMFPSTGKASGPGYLPDFDQRVTTAGVRSSLHLLDAVQHHDMPAVMGACNVGMILYGRDLGGASLPNRMFEYMAAGLAIIAPSYSPEIQRILEAEQCGIPVDAEDPTDLARAMTWMRDHPQEARDMGVRAREAFIARHCWEAEFANLLQAMDEFAPVTSPSA